MVLLAEIDRYAGSYSAAKRKLEEAAARYRQAGLHDENLRLWIEVHRGRLAAAGGRFAEAEVCYHQVVNWAVAAGSEAAEAGNMARLGLAMLYKGRGQTRLGREEMPRGDRALNAASPRRSCRPDPRAVPGRTGRHPHP